MSDVHDWVADYNDEALLMDNMEPAFIGIVSGYGKPAIAVYDADKCIKTLMKTENWDQMAAFEWFESNIFRASGGENAPAFFVRYERNK
mgnify:CR=1 FL=1|jgi:hypothetical protein